MKEKDGNVFISVKPDKDRLINLIDLIKDGQIKVPVFQREFVWKPQQMLELLDSILKGYPIGSLLFWKPKDSFKTKEYIGPYRVDKSSKDIKYVLDGFQRLSTLFGSLINPKEYQDSQKNIDGKEFQIFYNLSTKEFTYARSRSQRRYYYIELYKIIDTFEFIDFIRDLEIHVNDKKEVNTLISNAKEISKILYDYEIPFVEIKGGDIKSAVEIFSRINSTGTEISQDFMLSALSYNPDTSFLFSDEISNFLIKLSDYNFENLKRDTILNCISNSKGKIYFDVKIEDLVTGNLEELTHKAFPHIEKAVRFLHRNLFIWDVRLLPYPTQLIFISEYFRINSEPNDEQLKLLEKWFWITTYSNYFTLYSLSQQRQAYKIFMDFAHNKHASGIFKLNENFEAAKFPDKLNFYGVRAKALQLFMLKKSSTKISHFDGEIIKEHYIFKNKDRAPGNVILEANSNSEVTALTNRVTEFILNSNTETLKRHFINPAAQIFYMNGEISEFVKERETEIQSVECQFVESLGIEYVWSGPPTILP